MEDEIGRDSLSELEGVSLREILDQDSRPTFLIDLDSDVLESIGSKKEIRPIFCNAALRFYDRLLDTITGAATNTAFDRPRTTTYEEFHAWATGVTRFDESRDIFPLTFIYCGMLWTGSTVRQRWRMISGNQCYQISNVPMGDPFSSSSSAVAIDNDGSRQPSGHFGTGPTNTNPTTLPSKTSEGDSNNTGNSSASIELTAPEKGVPDWTVAQPNEEILSAHALFARSIDWSSTPLGPMSSWSREFREIANLLMRNPHPAAVFWGEDLTMLYNDAYKTEVAGNKHPALMGTGFSGPFAEIWDNVGPVFKECARTGNSVRRENDMLTIERYGYLEETFFSWSFTPLYGGTQRTLGFYNAPFETTYQTISSRRMQTLQRLGEKVARAKTVKQFWKSVLSGLEENHFDVPFALLYSIADSDEGDTSSHSSGSTISLKSCIFEGSIGVPDGHLAAPQKLDLKRSREGFVPSFREAMRTREPTMLQTRDGTLPEVLLEGINWRGFGEPCREAVIFPVRPTNGDAVLAFLLLGINPRRAYDTDYQIFTTMLNRYLATSLASVLLFEDELRRSRNAAELAALQREQLTQQLEIQTNRLRRMTEFSPLGMYLFTPDGVLLEANDRYYEMTAHPRDVNDEMAFMDHIAEGSRQLATDMWYRMTVDHLPASAELQIHNPGVEPRDLSGQPIEYWVLASSQPEFSPDGALRSIMGSITDISHIKWVQGLQDRRLQEAEETKRQQNDFIDITSHEMRNPLSAILICADDILNSLSEQKFSESATATIENCIEAANTIALCVQHQKSIVDDILTISKLNSNLLLITPIPVQLVTVIQRALNMFKPELSAKDIKFRFFPHPSLRMLNIDWVNLDPSRLLQIIVNLLSNAIKFTQAAPKREISVHIGASIGPSNVKTEGFQYIPRRSPSPEMMAGKDWDSGELLHIRVKVEDTGCGLSLEEKEVLFERFAQASPRTHAQYGGSGLGLYISRQLTELHGGQIGVASAADVGSTFGFYILATRAEAPPGSKNSALLPVEPVPQPDAGTSLPQNSDAVSPQERLQELAITRKINPRGLHILVVEDNLVNQKVLVKQLQKTGCIVSAANNGIFALEYLETTEFRRPGGLPLSVILMDLEMPEMDGLTCVGRIRNMEAAGAIVGHVPVIAVTANVRDEQITIAKNSGMDDVVSKPFRVPDLLAKIETLLNSLSAN